VNSSDEKSLISQRLLRDVSLAEVLPHVHKQTIKDVGDQDTDDQLALDRTVSPCDLLKEAEYADVEHQEVEIHALQE